MGTIRLTVAQAVVRFLANQYSERDGYEQRLIPGCFGIFGHGNVAGVGQALLEAQVTGSADLPYYLARNEQGMVHASVGYATDAQPAAGDGVHRLDRSRLGQHAHRRRARDHEPDPGAAAGQRHLRHPGRQPGAAGAGAAQSGTTSRSTTRSGRCRGSSTGCGVPSSCPRRCSARCGCSPTRPRPGRSRSRCPRTCKPRPTTGPKSCSPAGSGTSPRPVPEQAALARAVAAIRSARRPLLVAGGGVIYSEATAELARFAEATGIPVADTQAGKGAIRWDHPQAVGGVGSTGSPVANALARDADLVIGVGTRYSDFTTASRTAFQHPDVRFVNLNVTALDAAKHAGVMLVADAREGLVALDRGAVGATTSTTTYTRSHREHLDRWNHVVDEAYHLGHQPLPAQTEVLGALNETVGPNATIVQAAGSMPGDLQMLWRAEDPQAVPRRVRLLLHGLRDRRRARHQDGRARARGVLAGRRRLLPDDGAGDRHRGVRGHQADHRDRAEPRVLLDRVAVGVARVATVRHLVPLPQRRDRPARRRQAARSTSPPTPRASAPT